MDRGILIASAVIGVIALILTLWNAVMGNQGIAASLPIILNVIAPNALLCSGIYIAVRLAISDFRKRK